MTVMIKSNTYLSHASTCLLGNYFSDKCTNHLQNEMPLQAHHTFHSKVISIFILRVGNLREVRRLAGEVAVESLD